MDPQEFKSLLDKCILDAKNQGLSDEDIYLEFLEKVRFMTVKIMLKTLSNETKKVNL